MYADHVNKQENRKQKKVNSRKENLIEILGVVSDAYSEFLSSFLRMRPFKYR